MATPTFILPSAPTYTEGFVNGLNVYPNPTNFVANQVPFTRATTATRTNAAGLIELVPYNLFQYSEQFSNAIWIKTNVSISANTTTAPNGTLTADTLSVGIDPSPLRHRLVNADFTSQVIGTPYTGSFYLKANQHQWIQVIGNIGFSVGVWANFDLINGVIGNTGGVDTTATITNVGDGWYRCTVSGVATATSTTGFEILTTNNTNSIRYPNYQSLVAQDVCYVWGAQLVEGTAALPYQLTETRVNRPRVDFSLGGCPNLLLEPQRTNLALRSEEFDNASWIKTAVSVAANSTISPSGIVNADTMTGDGTSSVHGLEQNISVTSGVTYSWSIYAKKNTNNFLQIHAASGRFGLNVWANFDLNNGVLGSVGSSTTASIQSVGNGWYRCTMTATATATGSAATYITNLITSSTSLRGENNTLSTSVFLWGAQFETGAFPTTYIPTSSTSVTRNSDTFALSSVFTNNMISSAGGTWFVDLRDNIPRTRESSASGVPYLGDSNSAGVGNNFRILGFTASRYLIQKFVAGVATTIYITTSNTSKIAIKWNGTTADVFENGVKVVTATSFTATALDFLAFRTDQVLFNINSMALYNTPISDTECIAITTL
jgi:hypothetical protein